MKLLHLVTATVALSAALSVISCSDSDNDNGPINVNPNEDVTSYIDPDFAQELKARGYVSNAAQITGREVLAITMLDVSGNPLEQDSKLTSLKGIEYMVNLRSLKCKSNALTTLDLRHNTELYELQCQNNELTSLTLPDDDDLEILNAGRNKLTSLDLRRQDDLRQLDLSFNSLQTLDVRNCDDLTSLYLNNNLLTSMDIRYNRALTAFTIDNNPGTDGTLTVTVGFDPTTMPAGFTSGSWTYDGATVAVEYQQSR